MPDITDVSRKMRKDIAASVVASIESGDVDISVSADDVTDGETNVSMTVDERLRLEDIEVSTFETLDISSVMYITDEGGRVLFTLPDPAVTANNGAIADLQANATRSEVFETLDDDAGLWLLDEEDRVVGQVADYVTVQAHAAVIAGLLASSTGLGVFETLDTAISLMVTDAGDRIIQAVYTSDPALAFAVATNTSAVAALTSRVAAVVTPEGAPRNNPLNRDKLRWTHMKLAKLDPVLGEAAQLIICAGGDSYTHNVNRWIGPFTAKLAAKYGDAGGGWCGFGFLPSGNVAPWTLGNQPSYMQGNARPNTYPTRHIGSAVGTYYSTASPDLARATLGVGDAVYQAIPALPVHNGCDLFFEGSADGVVDFAWGTYNGSGSVADPASYTFGAATSLNVQGTVNALQIADIKAGIPAGAGMLRITCTAGVPKLYGVNLKSAASGVRVNKLAATGSNISQWANAPATHFETGIAALAPDLFVYMDGTNSQAAGISRSSWGAQLASLMGRIRAARPSIDILSATPAENQRTTNPIAMAEYALENLYRASVGKWCAVDMQPLFGDAANPGEYGSTGSMPLYASDLIHPDPATGGRLLLVGMLDPIVPYRGA